MTAPLSRYRKAIGSLGSGLCLLGALAAAPALGFCGFYVAQADSKLFGTSSKAMVARDAGRASVTAASDDEGDRTEFVLVVPVPIVLREGDIRAIETNLLDKLDADARRLRSLLPLAAEGIGGCQGRGPTSANIAPCGSKPWMIQLPPGT